MLQMCAVFGTVALVGLEDPVGHWENVSSIPNEPSSQRGGVNLDVDVWLTHL